MSNRRVYEFGRFRLDATGRALFCGNASVPLPPKAADTLLLLVENAGQVVGKQQLLKQVWPDACIEEGSLTRTVSVLRKALSEGGNGQEYIATLAKRGYRFVVPVSEILAAPATAQSNKIMLAVMPFENLSGPQNQEYFSDGLTEEMITQLGRLNPARLGVIARTSAMQYKRTTKSILQIGRELGVSHVLEGSVRRSGQRIRIAAQLIQVNDQTHLWAESYDRDLKDILKLQSRVAMAIAEQIRIKLIPQESQRLSSPGAIAPGAYEAYLRGRYFWSQRTGEALQKSIQYFRRALQIEPKYAAAYAGIADSYLTLQDDGHLLTLEATSKAKKAAAQALQIDETLSEPHISLAHASFHEFQWRAAEQEFLRGLELNPSYATAHFYYANYLLVQERFEEAVAAATMALRLDPLSMSAGSNLACALYYTGQYDRSIQESLKVLETAPGFARSHEDLGRAYLQKGLHEEAIAAFQKAVTLSGGSPNYVASLAHAYAIASGKKQALGLLEELRRAAATTCVSPFSFALVHTALGNKDKAFAWLEKACEERSSAVPFLKINVRLAPLRRDVRFQKLVRRIGLHPGGLPESRTFPACAFGL